MDLITVVKDGPLSHLVSRALILIAHVCVWAEVSEVYEVISHLLSSLIGSELNLPGNGTNLPTAET